MGARAARYAWHRARHIFDGSDGVNARSVATAELGREPELPPHLLAPEALAGYGATRTRPCAPRSASAMACVTKGYVPASGKASSTKPP